MRFDWSKVLVLSLTASFGCGAEAHSVSTAQDAPGNTRAALLARPSVELTDGVVRGEYRDGARVFIGIPYAAPPLGAMRWKPPAAVEPWQGVLEATGPGRTCVQYTSAGPQGNPPAGQPEQSEDCLQLNVFAPVDPGAEPVPVMVWLHGGSNATGSANGDIVPGVINYDGARLRNAAPREVVVVTLNYRLGPLGLLAHPALSVESKEHVSGNYGLLDQQAALRWVRDNIAAFGGDPGNVTLFGESAGAFDTCYQAVLKGSEHLFQRMIMESGSCTLKVGTLEKGEQSGEAYATRLGCAGHDASALECLRDLPATDVQRELAKVYPGSPFFIDPDPAHVPQWGESDPGQDVVVDGVYLKEQPITAFAAGRYARVPAIIGTNARENAYSYVDGPGRFANEAQYLHGIETTWGNSAPAVAERYALSRYASLDDATIALTTDYFFACPAWQLARRMSQHSDVYVYNWTRGVNTPDTAKYGAAHSVELAWVWDYWSAGLGDSAAEAALTTQTLDYWTALAATGDPNREGSPAWPRFTARKQLELELNVDPQIVQGERDARCRFWSKVFTEQYGALWAEDCAK